MKKKTIFLLGVVFLLSWGCVLTPTVQPTTAEIPTEPPSGEATTAPTLTMIPLPTAEPTLTTAPEPTSPPAEEPTPELVRAPEKIWIQSPGLVSLVTSPFVVEGMAASTFEQALMVKLIDTEAASTGGESLLAAVPTLIHAPIGQGGQFKVDLTFSIAASERLARVLVYSTSPKDGGMEHAASVMVKLITSGEVQIYPSEPNLAFETIEIQSPVVSQQINGGELTVSGYSEYFFESTLGVVLCGEGKMGNWDPICGTTNNVLASGTATIAAEDMGQPGYFSGTIKYTVPGPVHARLVVFAASPMDGGIVHLSSVEIVVNP